MDQRFSDYLTQYKANYIFTETERQQSELSGIRITVTLYEYDTEAEHRDRAEILMEKDGLRYRCEGIERTHWDFFPVTVEGRPYILFSKTLYGFTLIDPETLTEYVDFFPEKVMDGEESFIITHARSYGKYLILDGCYWGAPYEFAALDPTHMRYVSLTEAYGVLAGDHTAAVSEDSLLLRGMSLTDDPVTVTVYVTEKDIDRLMATVGKADF